MIPLRFSAEIEGDSEPFVVRVARSGNPGLPHELASGETADAYLTEGGPGYVGLDFNGRGIKLIGAIEHELIGDVLLILPKEKLAQRLIRAASLHNTLLVTEQCDQLCVMCSQPPKKSHYDQFEWFTRAVELAPLGVTIGISGGEPMLHKAQLFAFLQRARAARPDVAFHVLTNGQHFSASDAAELVAMRHAICWGIPLYAPTAPEHDLIVRKPGAFHRLLGSMNVLVRVGAVVELRTVIMSENAALLPRLARFVATHFSFVDVWAIMQLENAGYARNSWPNLFFDHSCNFGPIVEAISIATARGVPVSLYNFPRCTVPQNYRRFTTRSISDWKQRYLGVCQRCSERELCSGFFEWYPEKYGYSAVNAI